MCGRFAQRKSPEAIVNRFHVAAIRYTPTPRYNIAPTQMIAAITQTNERALVSLRWGLIPSWAKDTKIGNNLINARAETLEEKPSFRNALRSRRCLIPTDGWFEWKKEGAAKQPYFFHRKDDELFSFAGLWEEWKSPENELIQSCTIITTEPNELAANYHHRMPVILSESEEAMWLDPATRIPDVVQLLKACPADDLEIYPVSRAVNSPGFDNAEIVNRAEPSGIL